MYRYKITFAYDGSGFAGFQIQPHKRTIEQTLKIAVNKIAKNPTPPLHVIGSGRTDAGVHALNQVAHFDCPFELSNESMRKALNSLLPRDILVKKLNKWRQIFMLVMIRTVNAIGIEWRKASLLIRLNAFIRRIINTRLMSLK